MTFLEKQIERLKKEKYQDNESEDFFQAVKRLKKGEPYEYVLGYTMFLGCHIDLSLRPMIPRPESAFWAERAIQELKEKEKLLSRPLRLAEVFAGAGPIGCALLKHFPTAHVDICELDPRLKKQIEINVVKNGGEGRTNVIIASDVEGLGGVYDAIFAVPPYIPYEELPELDPEMIEYEPHMAFLAHEDGLEFVRLLIEKGRDYLVDGGMLFIEADIDDNERVREMVKGTAWSKLEFWADPYGATPNIVLTK